MAPRPRCPGRSRLAGSRCTKASPTSTWRRSTAAALGWRDAERTMPRCAAAGSTRCAGSPASTRRRRSPAGGCARASMRGECDLVVVYDRSALRMAPLARLCRAHGVPVGARRDGGERAPARAAWSPLYWDFVLGTRTTPRLFDGLTVITTGLEALYRARGCQRTLVVPAIEAWPPQAPATAHRPPGVPAHLRGRAAAPRRARGALRGHAQPGPDRPRRDPRRDRRTTTAPSGASAFARLCASDSGLASRVRFLGAAGRRRARANGSRERTAWC